MPMMLLFLSLSLSCSVSILYLARLALGNVYLEDLRDRRAADGAGVPPRTQTLQALEAAGHVPAVHDGRVALPLHEPAPHQCHSQSGRQSVSQSRWLSCACAGVSPTPRLHVVTVSPPCERITRAANTIIHHAYLETRTELCERSNVTSSIILQGGRKGLLVMQIGGERAARRRDNSATRPPY
eukprot:7328722-Pyramimonas_sp.AAC.1